MSLQQCAAAAVQVFPNTPIQTRSGVYALPVVMVAIAYPQSHWNPVAAGDPIGSCSGCYGPSCQNLTSWGLWQIHNSTSVYLQQQTQSTNPCVWANWLYHPVNNAKAAYYLYRTLGLARAWGGATRQWDTDAVEQQLGVAQKAVQQVLAAASSTTHSSGGSTTHPKSATPSPSPSAGLSTLQWVAIGSGIAGLSVLAGWGWHRRASFSRFE